MDRFDTMSAFAAVLETGSFTAAAARLGRSRAMVSKQVMALEAQLGAQLLNRTTRKVSPTELGTVYYEHARGILEGVADAESAVGALQEAPRGVLRVNAPLSFGQLHLAPLTIAFMADHPDLRVELTLNDRRVDPVEDGFDLTIRIGELEDSSLVVRRLCPADIAIVASPAYLAEHGEPGHPRDLAGHRLLHYGNLATGTTWKLTGPDGPVAVPVTARLCCNNGDVLRDAAIAGAGIAMVPLFICGAALQDGTLRTILPEWTPGAAIVHALYPPTRGLAAKVRLYLDFLVAHLGGTPPWALVS